jgi:alpha-L-fucosidase
MAAPGLARYQDGVNGHVDGKFWLPAEVDVSIRPGWFYHATEDDRVRTPENLMQIYYESVGRGASLLLNVPPDRRGLIHEKDAAALRQFRAMRDALFANNLAKDATASADSVRGAAERFAAANVIDEDRTTYWTTDDGVSQGQIEIDLGKPTAFNHIVLQEYVELGQRIQKFTVEARVDGQWQPITDGTSVGWKRILKFDTVTGDALRIRIDEARPCPMVSTVGIYKGPDAAEN